MQTEGHFYARKCSFLDSFKPSHGCLFDTLEQLVNFDGLDNVFIKSRNKLDQCTMYAT